MKEICNCIFYKRKPVFFENNGKRNYVLEMSFTPNIPTFYIYLIFHYSLLYIWQCMTLCYVAQRLRLKRKKVKFVKLFYLVYSVLKTVHVENFNFILQNIAVELK